MGYNKAKRLVLSFTQVRDGYLKTIDNAVRFFGASTDLLQSFPDKALALGQLGQEEIGRSLTLLAAFSLPSEADAWEWVWKTWSNHQLKAHRAYLYEIISPLRLESTAPDGRRFAGEPLRPTISQEKEAGLYVDFDHASGHFLSPSQQVSNFEAAARTMTLAYLCATADAVRRALQADEESFRLPAFAEIAFRICSENIYQQDMPQLIEEFRQRTPRHGALIDDLETAIAANRDFFHGIKNFTSATQLDGPSSANMPAIETDGPGM
jgi:AbiV family abortive infection protein